MNGLAIMMHGNAVDYLAVPFPANIKNGHIIEQLLDVIRYLGWQGSGIHFPLHDYKMNCQL